VETCSELLAIHSANLDNVLSHNVTGNEPRIHHWDQTPNGCQCTGSMPTQCHPGGSALVCRLEKSWPQFCWIAKVCCWWITFHIRQPWLDPTTVNCWKKNCQAFTENWRGMLSDDPMSTAAARQCTGTHFSSCTSHIVKDIGVEQVSHPPYSTDLAPSDFYLFRHLKKHVRRKRFCDDDEVKRAMESYLDSMPQEFYLTGLRGLFGQCLNCADVKVVTIEIRCSCFACVVCALYWIAKLFDRPSPPRSGLQFRLWQHGSVFIRLAVIASETREMSRNCKRIWPYSSSRSSKVINLGVNGKSICDFLISH